MVVEGLDLREENVFSGVVVCIIDFASMVVEKTSASGTRFATVTGALALVRME